MGLFKNLGEKLVDEGDIENAAECFAKAGNILKRGNVINEQLKVCNGQILLKKQ